MEEILHHLGSKNLANIGVNYLSTGAGFLPSTVSHITYNIHVRNGPVLFVTFKMI